MIRKHPFRFILSIVGSFFVHVAAVFAMLMAVPEIAPTELFRPISVSLVPESSIPGTGIQQEEQTDDMGSKIPSNTATSAAPAERTTEVAETDNRNEVIEDAIQAESEFENESDVEPVEVVDSEPETVPEPVPFEREHTPLPEQSEISAELGEPVEDRSLDEATELEEIHEQTNVTEQIARIQDPPESSKPPSEEPIEIDPEVEIEQPIKFVESSEAGIDLAHTEDTTGNDPGMRLIDEKPVEIRATLVAGQTQAAPERTPTDSENELIAPIFPSAIIDMADSQTIPYRLLVMEEVPDTPSKDAPVAPTEAALITEIEKIQPEEFRRTATDIESELIARVLPRAISDMADSQSVPPGLRNVNGQPEPLLRDVPVSTTAATLVVNVEEYQSAETRRTETDIESELTARVFPDAIQDVIDEHPAPVDIAETLTSQDIQSVETQTVQTNSKIPEPADQPRSNEPATLLAATDMEQETIVWNLPDAVQDVIDEHAPAPDISETADSRENLIRSEEDQPTETELADIQSVDNFQLNESLPPQSAADVEQELIARVLPDSIRDMVEDHPAPKEVHRTIDIPEIQSFEEHTQQTDLAIAEASKKRTVVDAADEVEVRFAYSEIDESSLLSDAAQTTELPEKIELKVASIAKAASPQIADENPDETEELSSSRQIASQNDFPHESEPVFPQPIPTKRIVEETRSVQSELSEQPPLERTQDSDTPLTKDNSVASETVQTAAIQSESETAGSMESADIAPQFGVPGISNPAPKYPYMARANNEEGRVILRVYVDSRGNAEKVETHTSSGFRRLDKAAKKAVSKWKFLPARTAGVVSDGIALVPVNFVLTN